MSVILYCIIYIVTYNLFFFNGKRRKTVANEISTKKQHTSGITQRLMYYVNNNGVSADKGKERLFEMGDPMKYFCIDE